MSLELTEIHQIPAIPLQESPGIDRIQAVRNNAIVTDINAILVVARKLQEVVQVFERDASIGIFSDDFSDEYR